MTNSHSEDRRTHSSLAPEQLLAHVEWLRDLARQLVGAGADADDLAQEVQVSALEGRGAVRDVRAYLARVLRNAASREASRTRRRRERERRAALESSDMAAPAAADDAHMEVLERCLQGLRSLPEAQRRAVSMRYIDGLSFEEIARARGIKASTARSNAARGIEALRRDLDGRWGGDRAAWSAALAPWVLGGGGAAGVEGVALESRSVGAGVSGAGGLLGVLLQPVPLGVMGAALALAGWLVLDDPEGLEALPGSSSTAEVDGLQGDGEGEASRAPALPDAVPSTNDNRAVATSPGSPAGVPVEGRLVDAATGEPVPGLDVRLIRPPGHAAQEAAPVVERVGEIEGPGGTRIEVFESEVSSAELLPPGEARATGLGVSDDSGRFGGVVTDVEPGFVTVQHDGYLDEVILRITGERSEVQFPAFGDVPLSVGPTFTPRFIGPPAGADLTFTVSAHAPGRPTETTRFPRRSGETWLRFPAPLPGKGPWTVTFASRDGLWYGETSVTRAVGIEPVPLEVPLEGRGCLAFVPELGNEPIARSRLTVEGESLDRPIVLQVPTAGAMAQMLEPLPGRADGGLVIRHLRPGLYRWSLVSGGATEEGSAQVEAGTVVQQVVRFSSGGSTSATILVDATAAPELDLSAAPVHIFDPESPQAPIRSSKLRPAAGRSGQWALAFDRVPGVALKATIEVPDGYRLEPLAADVDELLRGETTLRVLPDRRGEVTLRVSTGGPPPERISVLHSDGIVSQPVRSDPQGLFVTEVPLDRPTSFLVGAPGHDMVRVPYEPGRDRGALEVQLEPGHRTRAAVTDMESLAHLGGIEILVDGRSVGRTDALGEVWFEAPEPPTSVEIAPGSLEGLRVLFGPMERGAVVDVDGVGYPFMVATAR